MNQESTDFRESRPLRNEAVLTLALLRLLLSRNGFLAEETVRSVLKQPTLLTLSIVAEGLEDSTKTKHTVQFVSNIHRLE